MASIGDAVDSINSNEFRKSYNQFISLGKLIAWAVILLKGLICFSGTESTVVAVVSGSMEPGFSRGDILYLTMSQEDPIRVGEIVVFTVDDRPAPIVHRVIKVHEKRGTGEINVLTKGDNNSEDDKVFYAEGQRWLEQRHIIGRAEGLVPHLGWLTIILIENYLAKYILMGAIVLFVFTLKR